MTAAIKTLPHPTERMVRAVQARMDKGLAPDEQQYLLTIAPSGWIDLHYRDVVLICINPTIHTPETLHCLVVDIIRACVLHYAADLPSVLPVWE